MFVVLSLLAVAPIATAQATPAAAGTPTAKVECRMVQEPGSRIPTKVCRLDKEWDLLAKDAQDDIAGSRNGRGVGQNSSDSR